MHAIRGGLVVRTFALAKGNDSGERKSRIRRSKEERKAMVESFIKTYQRSNNGNFPSLNLTHKEVGGSFYTVREIVREIIQENRVLGPANLTLEEQRSGIFVEQYPLGSISIEPQTHMFSNGIHTISSIPNHQVANEEQLLNSSVLSPGPEHQKFDAEEIIDRSRKVVEDDEESDRLNMTRDISSDREEYSIEHVLNSGEYLMEDENQQFNSGEQYLGYEHQRFDVNQISDRTREVIEDDEEPDRPIMTRSVPSDLNSGGNSQGAEILQFNSSEQYPEPGHQRFDVNQCIDRTREAVEDDEESDRSSMKHALSSDHQYSYQEHTLNSGRVFHGTENQLVDGAPVVNGSSQSLGISKGSVDARNTESSVRGSLDSEPNEAHKLKISTARTDHIIADVVVETFPLRPISKTILDLGRRPGEQKEHASTLEDKKAESKELISGINIFSSDRISLQENSSGLVDNKTEGNIRAPNLDHDNGLAEEKSVLNSGDTSFTRSTCSPAVESIVLDVNDDKDLRVEGTMPAVTEPENAPNGIHGEDLKVTNSCCSSPGESISQEGVATEVESDIQRKGIKPTLDRINLESWDGRPKRSAGGRETNQLLAVFKAMIAALVKFWTE